MKTLRFTGRSVEPLGFLVPMFDPPHKGLLLKLRLWTHVLPNEFMLKQNLFPKFVFYI